MDKEVEIRLNLLKRAATKLAYESLLNANIAINTLRTDYDIRANARPLSVPVPKVKKAHKIEKILLAVRKLDLRYGSIGLDYKYFYEPLCDIADVTVFDLSSFATVGRKKMNEQFLDAVKKQDPDLVFSCICHEELFPGTIRDVSENSRTITCNWFADDHWRLEYYGRFYALCFNFCVTVDSNAVARYKALGYENILMSQWAANTALYHRLEGMQQDMGVTFVGQDYANRSELYDKLMKKKVDVQFFGDGWRNGRVSLERMIEIYNRSRINLNFSGSALNIAKQVKARVFDIPACGGFLLTEHSPTLENYYEIGKEIESFKTIDEAVDKIIYYLDNEDERKKIAERGYRRTMKDHLYQNRFKEIFKQILESSN